VQFLAVSFMIRENEVMMLAEAEKTTLSSEIDMEALVSQLSNAHPRRIIEKALDLFGDQLAVSFSGAEDVLLLEFAHQLGRPFRVFTLDTGRLHPETYRLFGEVEKRYGVRVEALFPEREELESLVRRKGMFSFYQDGHGECCGVRKVAPLRRHLKTLRAWITGQRRDQNPGTRGNLPVVQFDDGFEGREGARLVKFNPLAGYTGAEVWDDLRAYDVPFNALHQRGFVSIGCEPCTRPILPGQHEREGRWWWENADKKECGLHQINIDASEGEAKRN